jgi:hypothetical protein
MLLLMTAWGNAWAMVIASALGIIASLLLFRGSLLRGAVLAATVACVMAGAVATAIWLGRGSLGATFNALTSLGRGCADVRVLAVLNEMITGRAPRTSGLRIRPCCYPLASPDRSHAGVPVLAV